MQLYLKRTLKLILAALTAVTTALPASAADYYADDAFRNIAMGHISPVSGWDFDKSGGDILYTKNEGVILSDTSYSGSVSMERKLAHKQGESITVETGFTPDRLAEGIELQLIGNDGAALKIYTTPKRLMFSNGTAVSELCSYSSGKEIGVKIVVDTALRNAAPVINGVSYPVLSVSFSQIDKIRIATPEQFKVNLYVNGVKAYAGYSLNERFIFSGRIIPDNWEIKGDAELLKNENATDPDIYCLSLEPSASASVNFPAIGTDKARYEMRFLSAGKSEFVWSANNSAVLSVKTENGMLTVNGENCGEYNRNVWQRIELEVSSDAKASLMRNGKYIAKDFTLTNAAINSFSAAADDCKILIDDVLAYTDTRENVSVPTVNKVESADKYVGMIRCDIWREGNHMGWDYILPYETNHPYLGFYDDGNSAVADWETKWMAEHGVDFQMHCWFLPKNYSNNVGAIKTPNNAFAIEGGYFHSDYSDNLDFAIMWENVKSGDITYDTFANYIIPYWSEYYLSDPRYARADGKAVIGIYNADVFLNSVGEGDCDKAKQALNLLREECVRLGYSGAYILCASNGLSALTLEESMGFDACHAYTWRDFGKSAEVQKEYLSRAATNASSAGIGIVPTVGVGIDEKPWGRPAGKMLPPEEFKKVLKYADENIQSCGNMILLDNWNEYGEGHYIMPAGIEGFGYLDAVRSVLTDASAAHSDTVPTDTEKDAMGTLYDKTRKPWPIGEAEVLYGSKVLYEWTGESLASWKKNSVITSLSYENEILKGISEKDDPSIFSASNLNIDMRGVSYIDITLRKSGGANPVTQVFFRTSSGETFSEAKSVRVNTEKTDEWETVRLPVWNMSALDTALYQMRIDPMAGKGTFEIKSIRLVGSDIPIDWKEDSLQSWKRAVAELSVTYENGILKGTTDTARSSIYVNGLDVNLDNVNYIELRVKRYCGDSTLKMYYMTDSDASFTESKSIYVYVGKIGEWETVYIPVWKNSSFSGTLKQIRLDTINSPGSFELEYIRILKDTPEGRLQWYVGSETVSTKTPVQNKDGVFYVDFTDAAKYFNAGASYIASIDSIKLLVNSDVYLFAPDGTLYCNDIPVKKYAPFRAMCKTYMIPLEAVADIFGYTLSETGAEMTKRPVFPEKTYSAATDFDCEGKWLYRNLAEDPQCEDLTKFWNPSYSGDVGDGAAEISNEVFHSGQGSIKKNMKKWNRLGIETGIMPNKNYHISAWMKNESANVSDPFFIASEYKVYDENGAASGNMQQIVLTENVDKQFTMDSDWSYINRDVRVTKFTEDGASYPIGAKYSLGSTKFYITQSSSEIRTVYMDDINVRLIPDFRVYTNSVSHFDNGLIGNEAIVFTFSGDIDEWTVTPDKILIDGESGSDIVSVETCTQEETRQTKVSVSFKTPLPKGESRTVSLANIRDAWGREVIGTTSVAVTGGKPYLTAEFSQNAQEGIDAQLTLHNAESGTLIAALEYNSVLKNVTSCEILPQNAQLKYTIEKNSDWDEFKAFVWSDYKTMVPLTDKNIFSKDAITAAAERSAQQ